MSNRPRFTLPSSDALEQLRRDHERIRKLLREHERLRQGDNTGLEHMAAVVENLCDALSLCAQMEEEIFYPVVRQVLSAPVLGQTRLCDHARLRQLIAQIDEMVPADPGYHGAVDDIADCVLPSMEDARTVLFEAVRSAGLDTAALGAQMAQHRRTQQQQDLTRIGLPASAASAVNGGWPPACRLISA